MGRRGPKPTPTPMLRLVGSWRAEKREKTEPKPAKKRPKRPEWLDGDAAACWKQLVPQLEQMGVLTRIDGNALARYCQTWSDWRKCVEFIQKRGMVYPIRDEKGDVKCLMQFPQVGIMNKLAGQLDRLDASFGLTPSARTSIQVESGKNSGPQDQEDDLSAFAARRRAGA